MNDKKVLVVSRSNLDCAEPADWYRVDQEGEGTRLFQKFINNAENDGREKLELLFVTEAEWSEAERIGKELA